MDSFIFHAMKLKNEAILDGRHGGSTRHPRTSMPHQRTPDARYQVRGVRTTHFLIGIFINMLITSTFCIKGFSFSIFFAKILRFPENYCHVRHPATSPTYLRFRRFGGHVAGFVSKKDFSTTKR
jgi:hypothetical protein